jgi:hypothetical protein
MIKYSLLYLFFTFMQNFKPRKKKRLIMTCVFECFQSHCHIWKDFLNMMGAIIMFGKNNFTWNFVGYGLVTKSLGVGCTFEEVAKKTKCQKMNVNIFTTKLGWIISPSFERGKIPKATILYNDSQHNIPTL